MSDLVDSDNTVVALNPDLTIAFTNRAWDRFARDNGADPTRLVPRDRPILAVMAPAIRPFYRRLFKRVQATRKPEWHEYECPAPTLERRFRLRVSPLSSGLLLVHHLIAEHPLERPACPAVASRYTTADGMIVQCCHCRMTRRGDDTSTWDWVPRWVEAQPENLSHGLCPTCFRHYYPTLAQRWAERDGQPPEREPAERS